MKRKIIIDTDPGQDDAMAIMLAIKSGVFNIKAITTVSGNSSIENTTRNTRYILNLLDSNEIPVYSGARKPLKRSLVQAVVHGESGLEGVDPKNKSLLTNDASSQIIKIVKENPGIMIVTLGPLTNIAQAIIKNPRVMSKVSEIVMMGGAIRVPGNKNRVSEFNFYVDPEATKIVFEFSVKKTIVPLDACNHVQLSLLDFKKIKNPALRKPLVDMTLPYIERLKDDAGVKKALMYDPLTIFYLINPKDCKTEELNIEIDTGGELTRGMSIAELRIPNKNLTENNCTVVSYISAPAFKKYFISTLSH